MAALPDGESLLQRAALPQVQVALIDLGLPGMSGAATIERLALLAPHVRAVALTVFDDEDTVFDVMRAGAHGFLLKREPIARVIDAIEGAADGGQPVSSRVAGFLVAHARWRPTAMALSNRDQALAIALADGLSDAACAERMGIAIGDGAGLRQAHVSQARRQLQEGTATVAIAVRERRLTARPLADAHADAINAAIDDAIAAADAPRRDRRAVGATTLAALVLALAPGLPAARVFYGATAWALVAVIIGVAWLMFMAATVAFHGLGARDARYQATALLDELAQYGALVAIIVASGFATNALWLLVLGKSFAWGPQPARRVTCTVYLVALVHLTGAAVLLLHGSSADAVLAALMLVATAASHAVSPRMIAHGLRVRAERDVLAQARVDADRGRIARELHDGIGADVLELLLDLRRAAVHNQDRAAAVSAAQAEALLGERRRLARALRGAGDAA